MWTYILSLLLLRRFGLPRPIRYAFAVFMIGLVIIVFVYTANLFLTLDQRTSVPHVHAHSSH
jgi:hypothetical protein